MKTKISAVMAAPSPQVIESGAARSMEYEPPPALAGQPARGCAGFAVTPFPRHLPGHPSAPKGAPLKWWACGPQELNAAQRLGMACKAQTA
ncbi:MAG: hypothetical protein LBF16_11140, partial [Pseudomonadales bacterium]|nr:hypothetical protein [Pseudomonadales bacterium]